MRSRWMSVPMLVALLATLFGTPAATAAPGGAPGGLPVQLSLGDSWGSGVGAPAGEGYVDQLHDLLRQRWDCLPVSSPRARSGCRNLQLANLSVGGATTSTLIADQLPQATAMLRSRNGDRNPRNDVELVTLHIGGNDVTGPIIRACVTAQPADPANCQATISRSFAAFGGDLDTVLSQLRQAAGPDTPIVLGTYDNPIPTCVLASPANDVLGAGVLTQLHALMGIVAARYDVDVADVSGQLDPTDWVGGQDCLHPRASGYTKVAHAFADTLGVG